MEIKEQLQEVLDKTHDSIHKRQIESKSSGYRFACPVCGDSDTDYKKKRAVIVTKTEQPYFYCHHQCGGMSLKNFFKHFNMDFTEKEISDFDFGEARPVKKYKYNPKEIAIPQLINLSVDLNVLIDTYKMERIDEKHPVWQYLEKRALTDLHYMFLYWPKADRLVILNTLEKPSPERCWNETGYYIQYNPRVIGFQARYLGKNPRQTKYLTYTLEKIRIDAGLPYKPKPGVDEYIRIFVSTYFSTWTDWSKTVYVTEGPIDALHLENSIAITGLSKINEKLLKMHNVQFILDNDEPGKKKQSYLSSIHGKKIFNWRGIEQDYGKVKDLNELQQLCTRQQLPFPNINDYLV